MLLNLLIMEVESFREDKRKNTELRPFSNFDHLI